MANDSTTSGFLTPDLAPLADTQLEDALHDTIALVVGISDVELVRPRWQMMPPNRPMTVTNWISFGIVGTDPDTNLYEGHNAEFVDDGTDISTSTVEYDELLQVLISFYGPNAGGNDARLRAGLQLAQNREQLRAINVGVVRYQRPTRIPSLLKETWVPRVDATLVLRRRSVHRYNVRTVSSANGMLDNERYLTPLKIEP